MTSEPSDLKRKVREWLSDQGFPLEMRVAQMFRDAEFDVQQAEYYLDPATGKSREIDVVAEIRLQNRDCPFGFRLLFVVECKLARSKPWVLLSSTNPDRIPHGSFSPYANEAARNVLSNLDQIGNLPESGLLRGPSRAAYGVTSAFRSGDNVDPSYSACQGTLAAVKHRPDTSEAGESAMRVDDQALTWAHLKLPLVVLGGPLLVTHLDETGDLNIEETQLGRLRLALPDTGFVGAIIDVVPVDHLEAYVQSALTDLEVVIEAVAANPEIASERSIRIRRELSSLFERGRSDPTAGA